MSKHYPVEQRERAVKMVLDHLDEYRSVYAACQAIGPKVGVGAESLRRWVLQAQVDAQQSPVRFSKMVSDLRTLLRDTGIETGRVAIAPARRLGNHAGLERGVGVLALTSRFPVSEHLFVADSAATRLSRSTVSGWPTPRG